MQSRRHFLVKAVTVGGGLGAGLLAGPGSAKAEAPAAPDTADDIVIYGGTAAGVIAAIQGARMGKSVVLIEPGKHLGGMTTGGLGATDFGRRATVGGFTMDFYRRVYRHYLSPEAWKYETRDEYEPKHPWNISEGLKAQWFFEPRAAEDVLRAMLGEARGVRVVYGERLDRKTGLTKSGARITDIRMESGKRFAGKMYLDATYEGDLMAAAGVTYFVGREPNSRYGETLNGIQPNNPDYVAHIDPFLRPGEPKSGTLPFVEPAPPGAQGEGDRRVQAYTYRICLTDVTKNQVPIERPAGYDPLLHELLARQLQARPNQVPGKALLKLTPMPNRKTDSNNQGPISTDFVGAGHAWPDADYATREKIRRQHEDYCRGLLWFLQNDPRVPEPIRQEMRRWGLPKDEFTDTGHWPHQLYVREARRMVSDYVMTEHDCRGAKTAEDSVGLGSYMMDSHLASRFVDAGGRLRLDGGMGVGVRPYPISYRSIVPKESECANLLVPVCLSASHAAYGSIRMEPVFMMLAQSAATAAGLAIDGGLPVQRVSYERLRRRLQEDKQVLTRPGRAPAASEKEARQP